MNEVNLFVWLVLTTAIVALLWELVRPNFSAALGEGSNSGQGIMRCDDEVQEG